MNIRSILTALKTALSAGAGATAVVMVMSASPAAAGDIQVNWRLAGSLVLDVDIVDPRTGGSTTAGLLHFKAVGSPGAAEVRILSQLDFSAPVDSCLGGAGALFAFVANDTIATFNDLSQLYIVMDTGTGCLDFGTGEFDIEIDFVVAGGTGRFEGASGDLHLSGSNAPVTGLFLNAFADVEGTIHTP